MPSTAAAPNQPGESLTQLVRSAVIWRSGSQILAQSVQWAATFLVIRILTPADYGLFAMTGVVLVFLNMLNGYGLASALVQQRAVSEHQVRQLFGLLLLLNGGLALAQLALAPLAAAYYRRPEIADLLMVQALLFVPTPFIALATAQLGRAMDFRHQARANIAAAVASAATALGAALSGLGVWTLVLAPMVLFTVRAIGMTLGARTLVRPSFDFRGSGDLVRYGAVMAGGQLFWFVQSQADIFIAGRFVSAHDLGLYTTALFLTQILVSKFVPALNEVAFSAFARIQHDRTATACAFQRALRIILMAALPFYAGLAVTAEPLVAAVLGPQWADAAPIIRLLACAMPFMTLQVLLAPACDAAGRPGITARNNAAGSAILVAAFLIGVHWGVIGIAWAWLAAYPLYLTVGLRRALPVIGLRFAALATTIAPIAMAALGMAGMVLLVDHAVLHLGPWPRLGILIGFGGASYAVLLWLLARDAVRELLALIRGRPLQADWM